MRKMQASGIVLGALTLGWVTLAVSTQPTSAQPQARGGASGGSQSGNHQSADKPSGACPTHECEAHGPLLAELLGDLDLSTEQAAAVKAILDAEAAQMDTFKAQIDALHSQTRSGIDAVLTEAQRAQLEALEQQLPPPPPPPGGPPPDGAAPPDDDEAAATPQAFGPLLAHLLRQLDLTSDQQSQAKSLLDAERTQMQTIMAQLRGLGEQTRAAIEAILTSEQLSALEAMEESLCPSLPSGPPPSGPPPGAPGVAPPGGSPPGGHPGCPDGPPPGGPPTGDPGTPPSDDPGGDSGGSYQ